MSRAVAVKGCFPLFFWEGSKGRLARWMSWSRRDRCVVGRYVDRPITTRIVTGAVAPPSSCSWTPLSGVGIGTFANPAVYPLQRHGTKMGEVGVIQMLACTTEP